MTVPLSYCLQRRTVNDEKIHKKNIQNSLSMRLNNVREEDFNSDILIIDNKTTK